LSEYLSLGYVPYELNATGITNTISPHRLAWGSSGTTLEYALDDFAISCLAEAAGEGTTAGRFRERSAGWRPVLDTELALPRPRSAEGTWLGGDPASDDGFAEGSAAQYAWFVPQDVGGLLDALGGADAAEARLDQFFAELNAGIHSTHAFLGNEPTLHTPWLYAWLGRPAAGERVVREALAGLYGPGPGGYPGNDDLGTLSSWWVLSALGLYPAIPGTDVLLVGAPMFDRAKLRLGDRAVRLRGVEVGPGKPSYVRGVELGAHELKRSWLRAEQLMRHPVFIVRLGRRPSEWGTGSAARPPSFAPGGRACAGRGAR
jgi:predicted alpha-1,2-mannosidase